MAGQLGRRILGRDSFAAGAGARAPAGARLLQRADAFAPDPQEVRAG